MFKMPKTLKFTILAVAVGFALSACGNGSKEQAQQAAAHQQPAPVVGVVTVQPTTVILDNQLSGRLEARRSADVRAQVGGIITKRLFQEGSYVRAGQALYQLDSASYTATLESARANLASAQANLAKANADLARYKPLVEADAISQQEYDVAIQAQRAGQASVKAAQAAIHSAQINVNRSRITAPISGFIGQSNVSEGTLVSAGDPMVLARIQQTNPMYVNVTESATNVMKLRQKIADGLLTAVDGAVEVSIILDDGSQYAHKGRLLFMDPSVDEATGQVTMRAEVPNPDNVLLPGLYIRVSMPSAQVKDVFVIPQQAVTRGEKDIVMVVNHDGSLQPKEVKIAGQQQGNWIVSSGLNAGDKVVVDGTMIAGMSGAKKVQPQEWQSPAMNQLGENEKAQSATAKTASDVK